MATVLYPGSFDPLHNGHVEIIETAARLFDDVVVAAMVNPQKEQGLYGLEQRQDLIERSLAHIDRVRVVMFSGLVIDLARDLGIDFVVKGLRVASDFEVEMQMAQMNLSVGGIQTVFLPAATEHAFVSSRYIRDMARFGRDVSHLVPPAVAAGLRELYQP
jgi:pantetheine-phosphate adenylyltransferase